MLPLQTKLGESRFAFLQAILAPVCFWDGVLWVLPTRLEGREGVRGKPVPDSSNLLSLLAKSRQ